MKSSIILFLRHTNDLDHLCPVIWKWLQTRGNHAAAVFPWGNPVAENDFRLNLLREQANCRLIFPDINTAKEWGESEIRNYTGSLLPDSGKNCFVFTWLHNGMREELRWAQALIPYAHERNIPFVCLPHGDHCHAGDMLRTAEVNREAANIYAPIAMFDSLIVPNNHCGRRYAAHLPPERIRALGSPRFNKEWLNMLDHAVPPFDLPATGGQCKIALFLRHHGYPQFWEEIYWTIRLTTQFPHIHLAVVPHTRASGWSDLLAAYPELESDIDNLTLVPGDVYSGSIIRWADAVLDIGTSMAFEAVMRGKAVICPEYLHATRTVTSKYFPGAVALCRDELYDMIAALQTNPDKRFHSHEEAQCFISDMIHFPDENVLARYADFLLDAIERPACHAKTNTKISVDQPDSGQPVPPPLIARYVQAQRRCDRLQRHCDHLQRRFEDLHDGFSGMVARLVGNVWGGMLKNRGISKVALFGAGAHTRWLLEIIKDVAGPGIAVILDDNAAENQFIEKIPVIKPGLEHKNFDAVVLSTDAHQAAFIERCRELWGDTVKLIDLYEGLPPGPYPKNGRPNKGHS